MPAHRDGTSERPPRILVIDDNPAVRHVLKQHLSQPPLAAEVEEAGDGISGLRMAMEGDLDCVLCDLDMPEMNGFSMLRIVRTHRSRIELPVVFVTVRDAVAAKVTGFRCGAADFITKPFEPAELIARVETQVTLSRMHRELQREARVDPLTGAWNRRRVMEQLTSELARTQRLKRRTSLLIIDVDHFKHINDEYGHPVGDAVLADLVRVIDGCRRTYDGFGRIGGEEFALVLSEASARDAVRVAERLRARVAYTSLGGLPAGAVSVSIGVAEARLDGSTSAETLCKRADEQLYTAKRLGRNRVCCADVYEDGSPISAGARSG